MDSFFTNAFCMCWLTPFIGTVVLVMMAHGIHQSWRGRRVTDGFPHCAGCQYNLQGVSKLRCPECGKPLSVQSVLFRNDRQPLSLSSRLLIWTSFMPGPMIMLFMMLTFLWPLIYSSQWQATLRFTAGQQTLNVTIDAEDTSVHQPSDLEQFNVLLNTDKPSPRNARALRVDLVADRVQWQPGEHSDSGVSREGALNRETLVQALADFNLLDEQLDTRPVFADTLLRLIDLCERNRETHGEHVAGRTLASWNTTHIARRTGKDTGNVLAILATMLVGGCFWVWGMSIVTRSYENDWQRYTEVRQQIYSRFRDHVIDNATRHQGTIPTNIGEAKD